MKRRILLVILLLISTVANAGNWVLLTTLHGSSAVADRLEMDVDSIQRDNSFVKAWVRIAYSAPQARPPSMGNRQFQTESMLMEFDCAMNKYRIVQLTFFDQSGDQMINVNRRDAVQWQEIRTDRLSGLEHRNACNRGLALPVQAAQPKFGKYSFVVEKMAKADGCQGNQGAYLSSEPGPIETYRMQCDRGVDFTVRCEYGACTQQK